MCRDKRIDIRVTQEEKEKINKMAKSRGIKVSTLILDSVFNGNSETSSQGSANDVFKVLEDLKLKLLKEKKENKNIMQGVYISNKIQSLSEIIDDLKIEMNI